MVRYFQAGKWSRPANDPQIGPQIIREPETIPTNDSAKKEKKTIMDSFITSS